MMAFRSDEYDVKVAQLSATISNLQQQLLSKDDTIEELRQQLSDAHSRAREYKATAS